MYDGRITWFSQKRSQELQSWLVTKVWEGLVTEVSLH